MASPGAIPENAEMEKDLEKGEDAASPTSDVTSPATPQEGTNKDGVPIARTVTAQDWTGPDDPENPHNWPVWKRAYNTAGPGLLAFAGCVSL